MVPLSGVEGRSNCYLGFDFAQPDKSLSKKKQILLLVFLIL